MPLVIAHRGARGHAPENTLTSAALGHAVKADLWELDVNYTKDYKLVVVHDDTLVRTTNVEEVYPAAPPTACATSRLRNSADWTPVPGTKAAISSAAWPQEN